MSPADYQHSSFQGEIIRLLNELLPRGRAIPGCAVDTAENTKVPDVVWLSPERQAQVRGHYAMCHLAIIIPDLNRCLNLFLCQQGRGAPCAACSRYQPRCELAPRGRLCHRPWMQTVQLEEAQAHLPELVETVARGGEVLIARGERAVAKLVRAEAATGQPRFGSARGKITFHSGWDEPVPGFEDYQ